VQAFLDGPIEGDRPDRWIDTTGRMVHRGGGIVSAAVIVALGVDGEGRRKVPGMATGPSKAGHGDRPVQGRAWRSPPRRPRPSGSTTRAVPAPRPRLGVNRVVAAAPAGLEAPIAGRRGATRRCDRVPVPRNARACAGTSGPRVVRAGIANGLRAGDGGARQHPMAGRRPAAPSQAARARRAAGTTPRSVCSPACASPPAPRPSGTAPTRWSAATAT
jgi:hypothetical protein